MKNKLKIVIAIFVIALIGALVFIVNYKENEILDTNKTAEPSIVILGENKDFRVEASSDDFNTGKETEVWVVDKENNTRFVIDKMEGVSGAIVYSNTKKDLLVLSMGTSSVRSLWVYDLVARKRIANDCSTSEVVWRDYVIYSDCTKIKNQSVLETRSSITENGEYGPIIYKFNPRTHKKVVLVSSDERNIFSIDQNVTHENVKNFSDVSTSIGLNKIFVKDINEWVDYKNWKTEIASVDLE